MKDQRYPSDLTDREWEYIKKMVPNAKPGGRPRPLEMREVLNAIFYVVRGGIAWRMRPKDFPTWQSVYHYFREWKRTEVWKRVHDQLRQLARRAAGRHPQPSSAILDSQRVKTTEVGGPERGDDAGKKVKGRKRHLLVDTVGLAGLSHYKKKPGMGLQGRGWVVRCVNFVMLNGGREHADRNPATKLDGVLFQVA